MNNCVAGCTTKTLSFFCRTNLWPRYGPNNNAKITQHQLYSDDIEAFIGSGNPAVGTAMDQQRYPYGCTRDRMLPLYRREARRHPALPLGKKRAPRGAER